MNLFKLVIGTELVEQLKDQKDDVQPTALQFLSKEDLGRVAGGMAFDGRV
jgi:hypothetical protein